MEEQNSNKKSLIIAVLSFIFIYIIANVIVSNIGIINLSRNKEIKTKTEKFLLDSMTFYNNNLEIDFQNVDDVDLLGIYNSKRLELLKEYNIENEIDLYNIDAKPFSGVKFAQWKPKEINISSIDKINDLEYEVHFDTTIEGFVYFSPSGDIQISNTFTQKDFVKDFQDLTLIVKTNDSENTSEKGKYIFNVPDYTINQLESLILTWNKTNSNFASDILRGL